MPTLVDHLEFGEFLIEIGDGEDPEVFTAKCTINTSKGMSNSAEMQARNLPYCDAPDTPSPTLNFATGVGHEISGSGVLEKGDDKFFFDWLVSGVAKNAKITVGGTGGTVYTGAVKCSSFNLTGERFGVLEGEITLINHGELTPTVIV